MRIMMTYKDAVLWAMRSDRRAIFYEPWIAKDPAWALRYAEYVLKERFLEAEATIANSECKNAYLGIFPSAKDDWAMNGWIGWIDT